MPATSVHTYYRALSNRHGSAARAAGNYENGMAMKIAKFLGAISLGIGYGIIRVIEYYANIQPKIEEYARNSTAIYRAIYEANWNGAPGVPVIVDLDDGGITRKICFTKDYIDGKQCVCITLDGLSETLTDTSFENILTRIRKDCRDYPKYYKNAGRTAPQGAATLLERRTIRGSENDSIALERMQNALFITPMPETQTGLENVLIETFEEVTGVSLKTYRDKDGSSRFYVADESMYVNKAFNLDEWISLFGKVVNKKPSLTLD